MVRRPSVRRRRRRSQCSKIFSETALPIKAKFYVEPPWVGGTIFRSRHLGQGQIISLTGLSALSIPLWKPNVIVSSLALDFEGEENCEVISM